MSKIRNSCLGMAIALLPLWALPASAYDWGVLVHVTMVEATYLPTSVTFSVDTTVGTCTAGSILSWNIRGADATTKASNATGVYSALVTAMTAGRPIMIYGNNSGCTVDFLQVR